MNLQFVPLDFQEQKYVPTIIISKRLQLPRSCTVLVFCIFHQFFHNSRTISKTTIKHALSKFMSEVTQSLKSHILSLFSKHISTVIILNCQRSSYTYYLHSWIFEVQGDSVIDDTTLKSLFNALGRNKEIKKEDAIFLCVSRTFKCTFTCT